MSCALSQELSFVLAEFLLSEIDATRVGLGAEMDRLVDPMFDSIFDRLQTKLTNCAQVENPSANDHSILANVPLYQPSPLNPQISTSTLNPQFHQQHSIDYEPENDPKILAEVKREIEEERQIQLNMPNNPIDNREYGNQMDGEQSINGLELAQSAGGNVDTQPSTLNSQSNHQPHSIDYEPENDPKILAEVKQEIEEERQMQLNIHNNLINNRQLELQVNGDQLINGLELAQSGAGDCSQVVNHDDQLCLPPNQLNQASFVTAQPSTSSHLISQHQNVHYSHQQPNDPIHSNDNSNQQSEMRPSVQLIILPNVQVNIVQVYPVFSYQLFIVSQRQPTENAQPNEVINQANQFITHHLQCPLSECPDTFPESQLNQHMFDVHSIGPSRCLVKDCAQAFDNSISLQRHIDQVHQHTTEWDCGKCSKHFPDYHQLSIHNNSVHQLGHFQCSFSSCTFTGEYKQKVHNHYKKHKREFVCSQTGCNHQALSEAALKAHERAHLGIKPFRCKWLNCGYSSSFRHETMRHIRTKHLAQFESSNHDVVHDPKDYLEVASELL